MRRAIIEMNGHFLVDILKSQKTPDKLKIEGLPVDTKYIKFICDSDTIKILVESREFKDIPEGKLYPCIKSKFKAARYKPNDYETRYQLIYSAITEF